MKRLFQRCGVTILCLYFSFVFFAENVEAAENPIDASIKFEVENGLKDNGIAYACATGDESDVLIVRAKLSPDWLPAGSVSWKIEGIDGEVKYADEVHITKEQWKGIGKLTATINYSGPSEGSAHATRSIDAAIVEVDSVAIDKSGVCVNDRVTLTATMRPEGVNLNGLPIWEEDKAQPIGQFNEDWQDTGLRGTKVTKRMTEQGQYVLSARCDLQGEDEDHRKTVGLDVYPRLQSVVLRRFDTRPRQAPFSDSQKRRVAGEVLFIDDIDPREWWFEINLELVDLNNEDRVEDDLVANRGDLHFLRIRQPGKYHVRASYVNFDGCGPVGSTAVIRYSLEIDPRVARFEWPTAEDVVDDIYGEINESLNDIEKEGIQAKVKRKSIETSLKAMGAKLKLDKKAIDKHIKQVEKLADPGYTYEGKTAEQWMNVEVDAANSERGHKRVLRETNEKLRPLREKYRSLPPGQERSKVLKQIRPLERKAEKARNKISEAEQRKLRARENNRTMIAVRNEATVNLSTLKKDRRNLSRIRTREVDLSAAARATRNELTKVAENPAWRAGSTFRRSALRIGARLAEPVAWYYSASEVIQGYNRLNEIREEALGVSQALNELEEKVRAMVVERPVGPLSGTEVTVTTTPGEVELSVQERDIVWETKSVLRDVDGNRSHDEGLASNWDRFVGFGDSLGSSNVILTSGGEQGQFVLPTYFHGNIGTSVVDLKDAYNDKTKDWFIARSTGDGHEKIKELVLSARGETRMRLERARAIWDLVMSYAGVAVAIGFFGVALITSATILGIVVTAGVGVLVGVALAGLGALIGGWVAADPLERAVEYLYP